MSLTLPRFLRQPICPIPLRWVLIVPFVLQTVGAVALVGYVSYRSGQQATKNLTSQLLQQTSKRVSDRLTNDLQLSQQIVATNHLAVEQGTLTLNDPKPLRQQLWQQMILNPSLPANEFWSNEGNAIGYMRINSAAAQTLAEKVSGQSIPLGTILFQEIKPKQHRFFEVDLQGNPRQLLYQLNDDQLNNDFRAVTRYRHSISEQGWTSVSLAQTLLLQIYAVAPVKDMVGELQGVFAANYFPSEISLFLNQLQVSPTGQVFILERSGNLVATSASLEASGMRQINGQPDRLPAINSQDELTREISQQLIQQFGNFDTLKEPRQLSLTVAGQRQSVQLTPYNDSYGLDWHVVTVIPESDFLTEIQQNTRTTVLLCLLTLGMAIALELTIANRLTTRISQLDRVSQKLAAGDLTQRWLTNSSITEVQGLTQSFNQMAEQLQQSFDRIQVALDESEAKFTTIFRASPDPSWIATLTEGRCLNVNDSFYRFLGCSRAEAIGRTYVELQLWDDLADLHDFQQTLLQIGHLQNFEVVLRTQSGEAKTVLLAARVTQVKGQDCVVGVLSDITDRKQAELALQESEERFREIANTIPQMFFVRSLNPDRYVYLSPAYEKIWGRSRDELLQNP